MANEFKVKNGLKFPDGTVQTTASTGGSQVYPSNTGIVRYSSTTGTWELSLDQPEGNLVGTSGPQTLSNKTIAYGSNNLTGVQPTLVSGTNIKTVNGSSILGSGDLTISGSGSSTLTIQNKTAAYTVVAGDNGTIINCTSGTFVSLTAASTLGAGFNCWVWNTASNNTDAVTIDPDGSETIDGVATLILRRGEGVQIICDGTSWQVGYKKAMRVYAENMVPGYLRPVASGNNSLALFNNVYANTAATASGAGAFTIGGTASGSYSLAVGLGTNASSSRATAFGAGSADNGAQAVTGSGAMALGGSYASGADSFAVAIANNSGTYGANRANGIAIGASAKVIGFYGTAIGYLAYATGSYSFCFGQGTANGSGAVVISTSPDSSTSGSTVTAQSAVGVGLKVSIPNTTGKYAYGSGAFAAAGDAQAGTVVLRAATTGTSATVLTTNGSAAGSSNQLQLPNSSAYAFTGTIVARQSAADGTASAAWRVEGLIRREASAASTVLVNSALTVIDNQPGWTLTISADTYTGGLAITATGAAATNIRWVATIQTSEVTYA